MLTIPDVTLDDGTAFPQIGLGTYQLTGAAGVAAMVAAIQAGYRLLDSAVNYGNESEVGDAVRASGVDRDRLLVTTKIPGREQGFDAAHASVRASLERLGLDRVDLLLIHWPNPSRDLYVPTWRAMIELQQKGLVRSIGVSNFTEAMLEQLIDETGVAPVVNQVEMHPYFPQPALRRFHAERGIRTESWSPLARRTQLLSESVIDEVARAHDKTPTQVVLRWHTQLAATPIPKSSDPDRQVENADIFDFALTEQELDAISGLARGRIFGADPDSHEEM